MMVGWYVALVWYCWTQIRPTMSNYFFILPHHPQLRPRLGFDAINPLTTTHQTNTPNPPSKYLCYRFVMDCCVNSFNKYPSVGKSVKNRPFLQYLNWCKWWQRVKWISPPHKTSSRTWSPNPFDCCVMCIWYSYYA